ncbi:CBS domain-containing protein [Nonomuraea pusilla]|uniref:CBS domain-containing protein n=1 Tax=Nonomuraea pusilla TaxID=46177 RepID=UPI00332D92BA
MRITVKDVMDPRAASVHADTSFKDVAEVLVAHETGAVAVVDDERRVMGVVSEADLMRKEEFREQYHGESYRPPLRTRLRRRVAGQPGDPREKAAAGTAAALMTAPAVTVPPHASTVAAARIMDEAGIRQLVVVDGEGRLAGVVTRRDLLKVFLRDGDDGDAETGTGRRDGRDGVVVEVRNGIVTLSDPGALTR